MTTHSKTNGSSASRSSHASESTSTSPAQVALVKSLDHIAQAEQLLGSYLHPLQAAERKRVRRMRNGGEGFALSMARLAASRPMLRSFNFDSTGLEELVITLRDLLPIAARLRELTQSLEDTLLAGKGTAWLRALEIYRMAKSASKRDATLAAELAPWERFLSTGSRKTTKKGAPVPIVEPAGKTPL